MSRVVEEKKIARLGAAGEPLQTVENPLLGGAAVEEYPYVGVAKIEIALEDAPHICDIVNTPLKIAVTLVVIDANK